MASTYNTTTELKSFRGQTEDSDPFTETQLQAALDYAQEELDNELGTHFADGTDATPDYIQVTNEKQRGLGATNRDYFLDFGPIPDVSTVIDVAYTSGSTLFVDNNDGFLSSGSATIGTDTFTYTSKSDGQLNGVSGLTDEHEVGEEVLPYFFEVSTTCAGSEPVWTVLTVGDQYDLDRKTGRVYIYEDNILLNYLSYSNPPRIPNRFRSTYIYGHETIPQDLKKLHLMVSAQDLMHSAVRKAVNGGRDDFKPSIVNVDSDTIEKIKNRYYQTVSSTI